MPGAFVMGTAWVLLQCHVNPEKNTSILSFSCGSRVACTFEGGSQRFSHNTQAVPHTNAPGVLGADAVQGIWIPTNLKRQAI